jgi:transcriptional regulator with XRE-family HTH domain
VPEIASDAARIFGERVRDQRRRLAISQETLAELSGLHWTALGKVERGVRNLSLHNIVRIAAGLDIDPAELVRGLTPAMLGGEQKKISKAELIQQERAAKAHGS